MFFCHLVSFVGRRRRRWSLCFLPFDVDRRGFIFVLAQIVQALELVVLLPFHTARRKGEVGSSPLPRHHTDSETRSTVENERNRDDQHGKAHVSYFYLPFAQRKGVGNFNASSPRQIPTKNNAVRQINEQQNPA